MWITILFSISLAICLLSILFTKILEHRYYIKLHKYYLRYGHYSDVPEPIDSSGITDLLAGIFFVISIIGCILMIFFIIGGYCYTPKKNIDEYNYLVREIELSTVYSSDVNRRMDKWNKHLNDFNNLWFRFSVEDRSKYIIDVDAYLNKFKKD